MEIRPIRWAEGWLYLLDQTRLPGEEVMVAAGRYEEAVDAIREMRVRGAPAIGVTAAYAMALAARSLVDGGRTSRGSGRGWRRRRGGSGRRGRRRLIWGGRWTGCWEWRRWGVRRGKSRI